MKIFKIFTVLAFLLFNTSVLAATLQAKKSGVKITAKAKKNSKVLATLKKGDKVTKISRKGMYWKVKSNSGQVGYVSVMKVKRLASEESSISSSIRQVSKSTRPDEDQQAGARSRSSVMGVRGLAESDSSLYAGNVRPNMRLVFAMEDRDISYKEINKIASAVEAEVEQKVASREMLQQD